MSPSARQRRGRSSVPLVEHHSVRSWRTAGRCIIKALMRQGNIIEGGLTDPRVAGLLRAHVTAALAASCRCYDENHALHALALDSPDISFWTIWDENRLAGCGALREIDPGHGEVKSMYTNEVLRGRGFGGAMLRHILSVARERGYRRVSLETGTSEYFQPARQMYLRYGFEECGSFNDYPDDPKSLFMSLELGA